MHRVQKELSSLPPPTHDITNSLTNTMHQNATKMKDYREQNGFVKGLKEFKVKVQNMGEWDLKQKCPDGNATYQFKDIIVQPQDIGNIHYGYVGKAMGIPDLMLLLGGSYAQISAGTSSLKMFLSTGGDDLRDQVFIRYGIALYEEENKK